MNNNFKSYYDLVNGALANFGYDSMQTFIDDNFAKRYDNASWKTAFDWGIPKLGFTYTQLQGTRLLAPKATIIDFSSEKPLRAPAGFSLSSGKMPRMGHRVQFNEESFIQQAQLMSNYAGVVPRWDDLYNLIVTDTSKLLQGIHGQLNYMAFQIESTGKFVTTLANNPDGIQGMQFDFQIPDANKKKVVKVWSDVTADPIQDLLTIYTNAIQAFIPVGVFRMNLATWNTFRLHPNVQKRVAIQLNPAMGSGNNTSFISTDENIRLVLSGLNMPPIEVVDETSMVESYDSTTRSIKNTYIKAFADNTVILRPAGKVGTVESSLPIILNEPGKTISTYEGGRITLFQDVDSRHKVMEMIAEFTGIPVLNNPNYIIMLDTATAA